LQDDFYPTEFTAREPEPDTLKIVWTGSLQARKGLLLVLDVMARLKPFAGITLTIVGDGDMRPDIVNRIAELALEKSVTLAGHVSYSQVRNYYAASDVFFFTSLRDSGPTQLTEAMAYGLPVVGLNHHGQRFIINEETGIRCDCKTPEIAINELEKAILYLYNNPEQLVKMKLAAYEFAKAQTWRSRIDSIVKQHYPIKAPNLPEKAA
jgi:glycosyltransferase involved in cell wall biosynthesis